MKAAALLACVGVALALGVVAPFAGSEASFAAPREFPTGDTPLSVVAGDLNGDGKLDLATADYFANKVSVLLNKGDGSFRRRSDYPTGAHPYAVSTRDLNGDGKPDLVTANGGELPDRTVSILLNATGRCGVPNVRGATLSRARRAIGRANCRVGTIRRAYSKVARKGLVISERPGSGTLMRSGGKVNLVLSLGASPNP